MASYCTCGKLKSDAFPFCQWCMNRTYGIKRERQMSNAQIFKTIVKKEYEIMEPNTFIHKDEKKLLASFAYKLRDFVEPDDVETVDNLEFKKAIEIIQRISL